MHGIICIETEWQVTKKKNRLTLKEHRGQVSVPKGLHGVAEAATSFLRDNPDPLSRVPVFLFHLFRQKAVYCALLRREVDADGQNLSVVGGIRLCISLFFYLTEGSLG